jgi:hypothetical protein
VAQLRHLGSDSSIERWGGKSAPFTEQKESKMLEYMAIVFLINLSLDIMGII